MLRTQLAKPGANRAAAATAVLANPLQVERMRSFGQRPTQIDAGELIPGLGVVSDVDPAIVAPDQQIAEVRQIAGPRVATELGGARQADLESA